jgi:DNA modification methylase
LVGVFREVWRVLRDDGTLWLNLGDSYAAGKAGRDDQDTIRSIDAKSGRRSNAETYPSNDAGGVRVRPVPPGLKPKDLVGVPWRVAFALQADGWYLRSDVIWSKPNPMPESVTDRPTKAHEYLLLLTKRPRYFYDADAIREPHTDPERGNGAHESASPHTRSGFVEGATWVPAERQYNPAGRNRRSVWEIATQPFPEAHFATYPEALVRPCILAGSSERGECVACGAPWARKTTVDYSDAPGGSPRANHTNTKGAEEFGVRVNQRALKNVETTGWRPSCLCSEGVEYGEEPPPIPQTVLDPFIGSGTTSLVARKHGRRSIGIDLSEEYLGIAARRLSQLSLLSDVGGS